MWIWSGTPGGHGRQLGGRESCAEQQGSLRAGTRLRQHLRSHHAEREASIDELVRQALSGKPTPLEDRVEADLLGVANALVQGRNVLPS